MVQGYRITLMNNALREFVLFAGKYFVWLLVYITPIHPFLITIFILLFFDLVSGIYKAIIKREPITSRRMRDSIVKMVFYTIAVFISYQVDKTMLSDSALILTKVIGGYIMLIEFQSNIENISEITGVNIWKAVKNKILDYFNSTNPKKDDEL